MDYNFLGGPCDILREICITSGKLEIQGPTTLFYSTSHWNSVKILGSTVKQNIILCNISLWAIIQIS